MKRDEIANGEAVSDPAVEAMRAFLRVLDTAGGSEGLASRLGETLHRVQCWRSIPTRHLPAVEAMTGIPRRDLRPDIDFDGPFWRGEGLWGGWTKIAEHEFDSRAQIKVESHHIGWTVENAMSAFIAASRAHEAEPNLTTAADLTRAYNRVADLMGVPRA